jgi:ABC-type nitrate/sulfonate/bicarbonate transport system substrate-binding protein
MNFGTIGLGMLAIAVMAMTSPVTAQTNLTVMVFAGMQNLPLFAAQSNGLFAKRGLTVDLKMAPNSDELRNGLVEGRYQIVHGGIDNAVAVVEVAKADAAVVIGGDNGMNSFMVQPAINAVADIKGKKVAVDAPGTSYAFLLYEILRRNGLEKGDYDVVPVGATARRAEVVPKDKTLVATMLNPPFSFNAVRAGMKSMGEAVAITGPYQATAGFVMRAWARDNADTLTKYLGAYLEGVRWSLDPANKAAAIRLYVDGLKLSEDVAAQCYDAAQTGLARDAALDMEGFRNVLALRARHAGSGVLAPEKYLDLSYYQKALAAM